MWVLPLSLYLLTFVIAFDNEQWYSRGVFTGALVPTILAVLWVLFGGDDIPIVSQVVALSAALFVCCMVCHGELSRLRPDPRHLTGYYLMIALGGALGGAFVALIAPRVFSDYLELHLGLAAVCALTLTISVHGPTLAAVPGPAGVGLGRAGRRLSGAGRRPVPSRQPAGPSRRSRGHATSTACSACSDLPRTHPTSIWCCDTG